MTKKQEVQQATEIFDEIFKNVLEKIEALRDKEREKLENNICRKKNNSTFYERHRASKKITCELCDCEYDRYYHEKHIATSRHQTSLLNAEETQKK